MQTMKINGYIDLQVNGYLGVDFSDPRLTEESFAMACENLLARNTAAFLPTVITSSQQVYQRNLAIIAAVISWPQFKDRVLGIHAEGPFISDKPGAVGAHEPAWTKKPDIAFFDKMQEWAKGCIKLMTIAAEREGAVELCEYAVKNGTTISLGHQSADMNHLKRLSQAGASLLTHVGNAMPNLVHRHNNSLLTALAVKELTAMIITDGHHLPPHVIEAIINTKGTDKIIITSDASPIAGMPIGTYEVLGNTAVLEENGLLHNPKKQCLVGSSATMAECVEYVRSLHILTEQQIEQVSNTNPLKALKIG